MTPVMADRDKSQSPEFTVGIDAKWTFVDKRSRPNLQRMTPSGLPRQIPNVITAAADACSSPLKRRDYVIMLRWRRGGVADGGGAQQPAPNAVRIGWLKIQGPRHTPSQLQAFREGKPSDFEGVFAAIR